MWTRGDYPRTLTLDKQGRWLYVMNQRSDNITRFRVAQDGKLSAEPDYTRSAAHPRWSFHPKP